MNKLIYGVAINDADYKVEHRETISAAGEKQKQRLIWRCPFYSVWRDMLTRGFSEKFKIKYPTYSDCSVSAEWLVFSKFKMWMERQDWEGNQIDKDLIIPGNKLYSPETCVFVSGGINNFILDNKMVARRYPIGLCLHKSSGKLVAQCKQLDGKSRTLGYFSDPMLAHKAWLSEKVKLAKILAGSQPNQVVANALIDRYENYHEYFTPYGVPLEC